MKRYLAIGAALAALFSAGAARAQVLGPASNSYVTNSATGTTGATTATLPALQGQVLYLCGFSIRANATAAATGDATVTGLASGTVHFTQWTAPLASGIGIVEPPMGNPCVASSGVNQAVAVISAAPGAGGTVSVSAWGYYRQQ